MTFSVESDCFVSCNNVATWINKMSPLEAARITLSVMHLLIYCMTLHV